MELLLAQTAVEVGYPYVFAEQFWLRPCLDMGVITWCHMFHSQEPGWSNYFRWHLGWDLYAAPGLELAAKLFHAGSSSIGVFVNGSYVLPLGPTQWYGDPGPPDFGLRGLLVQFGLRFARAPTSPFRI
ncbi:MAG: hypothetical protein ABIK37_03760 [candidate division WOR-3 bacterium]